MKHNLFAQWTKRYPVLVFAFVGIIVLGLFSIVKAASPGDLDTTFSGDGVTYTDFSVTNDMAFGVAVQSDGKVVSVGESENNFGVVRYNGDGSLDVSFSGDGIAVTAVSANRDRAQAVAIEPDGQIVVVGFRENGAGLPVAFVAVRYNADGSLDTNFGSGGIFSHNLGGTEAEATAVAIQNDGKIIIAGTVDKDFAVARLDANTGALDTSFNSVGYNTTDINGAGNADEAHGVVIQATGSIVLGGTAEDIAGNHQDFALARYTSSGSLDTTTFGAGGVATVDVSLNPTLNINDLAYGLGEQSDGSLVLAGIVETGHVTNAVDIGLARFSADGVLDTAFGSGGTVITANAGDDWVNGIAVQPTDKIVVAGFRVDPTTHEDFQLVRYNADGSLDTAFGASGFVITDIGSIVGAGNNNSQDEAYDVAVYNDKIVVVGLTDVPLTLGNMNFAAAQYASHNMPPTLTDILKSGDEDSAVSFTAVDFVNNFDDSNGDSLVQVQITSLPANGTLQLNGVDVSVAQEIATANLNNLTYTPDNDWFGDDSFSWNGFDGLDYALTDASVNITIANINDAPSFTFMVNPDQFVSEDAGAQSVVGLVASMDPGPNEGGQTIDFLVTNDNTVLFAVQPTIDGNGALTYTPAPNRFGAAAVSVRAHDDGGTDNGGVDTSAPQTFTITISAVNDPPSFTGGGNVAVNEDNGATTISGWATDISAGPFESQTISFDVTTDNLALFTSAPTVSEISGDLTFTPGPDLFGTAIVTVTLSDNGGGDDTSAPTVFTLTVNPVNDPPSFTGGPGLAVLEDAGAQTEPGWAMNMSTGPANESGQTWQFNVSTDNDELFATLPTIDPNGNLTYMPAEDANGSATVTVVMQDDGGIDFGGDDTSDPQMFVISVTAVNDAPSFTGGPDVFVDEEFAASGTTVPAWAANISAGPTNESGQMLAFDIVTDNDALFVVLPTIDPISGDLTFTAVGGSDDSAMVTATLSDDGGTANGGFDTSAPQMFTITVTFINDPPTFTVGPDQMVDEDAGLQTVPGWATEIDPGSPGEAGQTLTFHTVNDNGDLFAVAPAIDAVTGDLTYTPADDANGSATVTVTLSDDGGTAHGGRDTSDPQTFIITVNPLQDLPTVTNFNVSVETNTVVMFTATDFEEAFADVDGDSLAMVLISSLPANGILALDGTAVTINQEIPVADLDLLTFTPDTDWKGMTSFNWNGSDGIDYAAVGAAVNISVGEFMVFLPVIIKP